MSCKEVIKRFEEYISWIDELPENTPKEHYISILRKIQFDMELTLKESDLDKQPRRIQEMSKSVKKTFNKKSTDKTAKQKLKELEKKHCKKSKLNSILSAFDYADNFYKKGP